MKDLIEIFGSDNLIRWSDFALADVNISVASKTFLTTVGLPADCDGTLHFISENTSLPRCDEINSLRIIGYDEQTKICLDENNRGRVLAVEPDYKLRPINSTVEQFGLCLASYQSYRVSVRGMDDDEALSLIDDTERCMRSIDFDAFSEEEGWWPVIIEQMRSGML